MSPQIQHTPTTIRPLTSAGPPHINPRGVFQSPMNTSSDDNGSQLTPLCLDASFAAVADPIVNPADPIVNLILVITITTIINHSSV